MPPRGHRQNSRQPVPGSPMRQGEAGMHISHLTTQQMEQWQHFHSAYHQPAPRARYAILSMQQTKWQWFTASSIPCRTQQARAGHVTAQPTNDEGEFFDLDVSDNNSNSLQEYIPPSHASDAPVAAASNTINALAAIQPVLAPGSQGSSRSTTAHDINYFFSRGDKKVGSQTVCKVCKWVTFMFQ